MEGSCEPAPGPASCTCTEPACRPQGGCKGVEAKGREPNFHISELITGKRELRQYAPISKVGLSVKMNTMVEF